MWINLLYLIEVGFVSWIITWFYSRCLNKRFRYSSVIMFILVYLLHCSIRYIPPSALKGMLSMSTLVMGVIILFKDKFYKTCVVALFENIIIFLSDSCTTGLYYTLGINYLMPLEYGNVSINLTRIIMTTVAFILLVNFNICAVNIWKKQHLLYSSKTLILNILPCTFCQNLILFAFINLGYGVNSSRQNLIVIVTVFLLLVEIFLMYYLLICIYRKQVIEDKVKLLEQDNRYNQDLFRMKWDNYQKIKKLRHDTKNYLATLEYLEKIDKKQAELAVRSLEQRIKDFK